MIRIGVDIGGTKVEAAALDAGGAYVARVRKPNPGTYDAFVEVVRDVVAEAEAQAAVTGASVGVGMPGSISKKTGLMRNANSVWMNDRPMREDLARALGRPIRMENDANCFALSEATDGAAAGARVVFGAIIGTGCGGGVVVDGRTLEGRNGVGGEWGHTPLPWPS
jgi:fructokinase